MRISDWSSDVCSSDLGRRADKHRIAIREVFLQFAIADDFGRTDEREVLRPEEHDLPLAAGIAEVQRFACREGADALLYGNGDCRKFVANCQHDRKSVV